MPIYNLIEFSNNYSDTLVSNANPDNVPTDDSTSFKYKASFFKPVTADDKGVFKDVKIAVSLKYLSNFWRSLEIHWLIVKFISN